MRPLPLLTPSLEPFPATSPLPSHPLPLPTSPNHSLPTTLLLPSSTGERLISLLSPSPFPPLNPSQRYTKAHREVLEAVALSAGLKGKEKGGGMGMVSKEHVAMVAEYLNVSEGGVKSWFGRRVKGIGGKGGKKGKGKKVVSIAAGGEREEGEEEERSAHVEEGEVKVEPEDAVARKKKQQQQQERELAIRTWEAKEKERKAREVKEAKERSLRTREEEKKREGEVELKALNWSRRVHLQLSNHPPSPPPPSIQQRPGPNPSQPNELLFLRNTRRTSTGRSERWRSRVRVGAGARSE